MDVEVRARHILLVGADASQRARDLMAEIQAGKLTFEDAAAKHSKCPSASRGGDLGFFGRGAMVPEFERAAFAADVGALSVVDTNFGTHVVRVEGERKAAQIGHMSTQDLADLLADPEAAAEAQLIDVREDAEVELARLPGFSVYPLSSFKLWAPEFMAVMDRDTKTVVLCHHGQRSMNMCAFLVDQGFTSVFNVTGGIDAYALMDERVPRY